MHFSQRKKKKQINHNTIFHLYINVSKITQHKKNVLLNKKKENLYVQIIITNFLWLQNMVSFLLEIHIWNTS